MIKKNFPIEYNGEQYWFSRSVACGALVFAKDKLGRLYVLANRRGAGAEVNPGMWNIPGGFIDFNENGETCAARECFEETGVGIDPDDLQMFDVNTEPNGVRQTITIRYITFIGSTIEDIPLTNENCEPNEVDEIRWFDVTDEHCVKMLTEYVWTRGQLQYIELGAKYMWYKLYEEQLPF